MTYLHLSDGKQSAETDLRSITKRQNLHIFTTSSSSVSQRSGLNSSASGPPVCSSTFMPSRTETFTTCPGSTHTSCASVKTSGLDSGMKSALTACHIYMRTGSRLNNEGTYHPTDFHRNRFHPTRLAHNCVEVG